MKTVFILLSVALVAATTCLAAPARLSGVRNINNGLTLLPTADLAGRAAAAINGSFSGQARSFNDRLPGFDDIERAFERP
jgi:hypothetical protein